MPPFFEGNDAPSGYWRLPTPSFEWAYRDAAHAYPMKSIRQHTVGIMGASLATGNRGVSALAASLVKLTGEMAPKAQAFMLLGDRYAHTYKVVAGGVSKEVPVINFRVSPRSEPNRNLFCIAFLALVFRFVPFGWSRRSITRFCPWIKAVEGAALVGDIRGGDSFSDIYRLREFLLASLAVVLTHWVCVGVVLFPQTF